MSLASQTARTASNWSLALTLTHFIGELEAAKRDGRAGLSIDTALEIINDKLTALEAKRVKMLDEPRVKAELAACPEQLAEVVS
jgi:hypothetical protein